MSDLICFSRSRISPTSTSFIQQQRSIGSKMFKASSMLSVMLLVALFCLVIFTATTVNSQEKSSTTSAPASVDGKSNDAVLVEEIGETPLMKEKPVGTPSIKPCLKFFNHAIEQSNGEAFICLYDHTEKVKLPVELLSMIFNKNSMIEKYFERSLLMKPQEEEDFEQVIYRKVMSEEELEQVLAEWSLFGGAYVERAENSLALEWAQESIDSMKRFILNQAGRKDSPIKLEQAHMIDLYMMDSNLDSSLETELEGDWTRWINRNQPNKDLKHFFNRTIWDKLILCEFTIISETSSTPIYLVLGITDKE